LSPTGSYVVIATNLTALAFTNSGLADGTIYYYTVTAINSAGESTASPPVSAQPLSQTPPQLGVAIGGGSVQLAWPSDHVGWTLQFQTNAPGAGLGTNWQVWTGSSLTNQVSLQISPDLGSVFLRLVLPK
jgi:cellulose 1,4-beta-cellobiosidase